MSGINCEPDVRTFLRNSARKKSVNNVLGSFADVNGHRIAQDQTQIRDNQRNISLLEDQSAQLQQSMELMTNIQDCLSSMQTHILSSPTTPLADKLSALSNTTKSTLEILLRENDGVCILGNGANRSEVCAGKDLPHNNVFNTIRDGKWTGEFTLRAFDSHVPLKESPTPTTHDEFAKIIVGIYHVIKHVTELQDAAKSGGAPLSNEQLQNCSDCILRFLSAAQKNIVQVQTHSGAFLQAKTEFLADLRRENDRLSESYAEYADRKSLDDTEQMMNAYHHLQILSQLTQMCNKTYEILLQTLRA
ncbi:hypothetical protein Sarmat_01114 [Rickettsiales endosymbiont of Paramecium tredecaurelia]|uniref:hypothetical protein n=1 Tax=Candidatus Sarmatiella mevalonica TaxID=2770581 RepID=UPI0019231B41|nr:hypothetical protein [Candidatus Sarmatiella mevalonica]MBL3285242.1 hypothetical protein [Candidatus Sarmatiella mevalonica]